MILKTRRGSDIRIQAASGEWGNSAIPQPGSNYVTGAGVIVTHETAWGLPAVSNVLRSPAEIIASMPFLTHDAKTKQRAEDTWQWKLFHDTPTPDTYQSDVFQFFYDLVLSIEATQNAFVRKVKLRDEVIQVEVIDPQRVRCHMGDDGRKRFDIWNGGGSTNWTYDLTIDDIFHVRGATSCPGGYAGQSLLEIHRNAIGNGIAMQGFEGDFFRNHALPPFFFTGAANRQQAQDILDFHNQKHAGSGNQWKAGGLWGALDVKALPISMRDAMFIEAKNMAIEDVCRIWRWPRRLMELGEQAEARIDLNQADAELLKLYLLPRLRRIERAFAADPDFYYESGFFGEFLTAGLERGDVHTRFDAYRLAKQGGWITANEIRELENLPPHPDGDELQVTPVGGAPNTDSAPPAIPPPANGATNGHNLDAELADIKREVLALRNGGTT